MPEQSPQQSLKSELQLDAQAVAIINDLYPLIGTDFKVVTELQKDGHTVTMKLRPITPRGKDFVELYLAKHMPSTITRKVPDEKRKTEPADKT